MPELVTVNFNAVGEVGTTVQSFADRSTDHGVYTVEPGCNDLNAANPHPTPRWLATCDNKWASVAADPSFIVQSLWYKAYYPGAVVAGDYIEARLVPYYSVRRGILRFPTSGVAPAGKTLTSAVLKLKYVNTVDYTKRNSPNDLSIHVVPCSTTVFPITTAAIATFTMGTNYGSVRILEPSIPSTVNAPVNITLDLAAINLAGNTILGLVTTHDKDGTTPPIQPADAPPTIPFHQQADASHIQDNWRFWGDPAFDGGSDAQLLLTFVGPGELLGDYGSLVRSVSTIKSQYLGSVVLGSHTPQDGFYH